MTRKDFVPLIIDALKAYNGSAKLIDVCKHVYTNNTAQIHEDEVILYTWQYEIRWAAQSLRHQKVIVSKPRGYWTLVKAKGKTTK